MQKSILGGLLFLLVLSPLPVFAEDSASSSSSMHDMMQKTRKDIKTTIAQERESFKEKVAALKDQRKKTIVERVGTKLPQINSQRTTQMGKALTRMNQMLDSISSKAATAKQNGKNTTILEQKIQSARTAITLAQDAVTTQAAKTYELPITDENTLKTTIGKTFSQLMADLRATHKKVIAAREAVRKAFVELAKISDVLQKEKEHTASQAAQ